MSSFFDDASLVQIPSGYKVGTLFSVKPTDGTGDLTFTRSNDTATRVGPDGLIEKVRTNLQTYSQDFTNAVWVPDSVSISGGQTDPNGGTTAALVTATTSTSVYFYTSSTTVGTYSVYAKAGNRSIFSILNGSYNNGGSFNLATQTATSAGQSSFAKIEDVGGGWYRCSVYISSAYLFLIALSDISGGGMNSGDTMSFAFAQRELGDIATDYIPTTTAAVSVGVLANLPRLDYSGGATCPKLLLEGQRTNVCLWSEQINNAAWVKEDATITANAVTSPSGYQDADTLTDTTANTRHRVYSAALSFTAGTAYTFSVFVKKESSGRFLLLNAANGAGALAALDLDTLAVTNLNGTGKVEGYGNGWYRFSVTGTAATTQNAPIFIQMQTAATDLPYVGNGSSFYLWGAQLEAGSYATSYIGPTLGAAVTRGADLASKTGISSLIGQLAGTFYAEWTATAIGAVSEISLSAGTNQDAIRLRQTSGGALQLLVNNSAIAQASIPTAYAVQIGSNYKLAVGYAANDFVFYVNGEQIGTDNSGTPPTCSQFQTDRGAQDGASLLIAKLNQVLIFPTRLTNAQLAELTA